MADLRSTETASAAVLAGVSLLLLSGCGRGGASSTASLRSSTPSYAAEPFTHQEQLVEQGARLVVADGCSACHLAPTSSRTGPSFDSFAGHYVTLADGRRVLVDERFLKEALRDAKTSPIKGYDPAPMLAAIRRLHLSSHPDQITALSAFIEQIGPEPG